MIAKIIICGFLSSSLVLERHNGTLLESAPGVHVLETTESWVIFGNTQRTSKVGLVSFLNITYNYPGMGSLGQQMPT